MVSCYHMNCCLQKYIIHHFTYFIYLLFISKQFQKCKNGENPTSTSEVTSKTIFILLAVSCKPIFYLVLRIGYEPM